MNQYFIHYLGYMFVEWSKYDVSLLEVSMFLKHFFLFYRVRSTFLLGSFDSPHVA